LHASNPLSQRQADRWQVCPAGHTIPQPPQLSGSPRVVTHAPPHVVSPRDEQLDRHLPRAHTWSGAQALPQAPQLS
jgi:hypothetical protein